MKTEHYFRTVRRWRWRSEGIGLPGEPWVVAFASHHLRVAIGDTEGNLVLGDLSVDNPTFWRQTFRDLWISTVAFSPDAKFVAVGTLKGFAYLMDLQGLQIHTIPTRLTSVTALSFSHDGSLLALVGDTSFVEVWDMKSQVVRFTMTAGIPNPNSVAFSSSGSLLAVGGGEGSSENAEVGILDIASNRLLAHLEMSDLCVDALGFDLAGRRLGCGCYKKVYVWDMERLQQTHEFPSAGWSCGVYFATDTQLINIGEEGELCLWDLESQKSRCLFLGGSVLGGQYDIDGHSFWIAYKTDAEGWVIDVKQFKLLAKDIRRT